jgi:hypothetical protein
LRLIFAAARRPNSRVAPGILGGSNEAFDVKPGSARVAMNREVAGDAQFAIAADPPAPLQALTTPAGAVSELIEFLSQGLDALERYSLQQAFRASHIA